MLDSLQVGETSSSLTLRSIRSNTRPWQEFLSLEASGGSSTISNQQSTSKQLILPLAFVYLQEIGRHLGTVFFSLTSIFQRLAWDSASATITTSLNKLSQLSRAPSCQMSENGPELRLAMRRWMRSISSPCLLEEGRWEERRLLTPS